MTILAVCGLKKEAKIATGPGVIAVMGGGDAEALTKKLDAFEGDITGIISFRHRGRAVAAAQARRCGDRRAHRHRPPFPARRSAQEGRHRRLRTEAQESHPGGRAMARCDNAWRVAAGGAHPGRPSGRYRGQRRDPGRCRCQIHPVRQFGRGAGGGHGIPYRGALRGLAAGAAGGPSGDFRFRRSRPAAPPRLVAMNPDGSIAAWAGDRFRCWASPWQIPSLIRTASGSGKAFRQATPLPQSLWCWTCRPGSLTSCARHGARK